MVAKLLKEPNETTNNDFKCTQGDVIEENTDIHNKSYFITFKQGVSK